MKPLRELAGFEKVHLKPGESRRVTLYLESRQLRTLNMRYEWHVEPGEFRVMVGTTRQTSCWKGDF